MKKKPKVVTVEVDPEYEVAVWVSPRRLGGSPCINGTRMPTEQVASLVWGSGMKTVRQGWPHLTDAQILIACWYEVVHGNRARWRRQYQDWPKEWNERDWRDRHA